MQIVPSEQAQKSSSNVLGIYLVIVVVFVSAVPELKGKLPDSFQGPYLGLALGVLCGSLASIGVLLSFWWALRDSLKTVLYFAFLCFFAFLFMTSAMRGLIHHAGVVESVALFSELRPACTFEGDVCRSYVFSQGAAEKQRGADLFFAQTGVNLTTDQQALRAVPPSSKAADMRKEKVDVDKKFADLNRLISSLGESSLRWLYAHLVAALLTFVIGGYVMKRRRSMAL
jgi:hypothetical protein